MNLYAYVNGDPVQFADPTGLRTFGIAGSICVQPNCDPAKLPPMLAFGEDGGGLGGTPPPGGCADADALYMSDGVRKIYDGMAANVICDCHGNLQRVKWGGPFFPKGTPLPPGWPANPL